MAEAACAGFMLWFDSRKGDTWPGELHKKISAPGYRRDENNVPALYDIVYGLKKHGSGMLQSLADERRQRIEFDDGRDMIKSKLLGIVPK